MKKIYISLILIIMILTIGNCCLAAQFYDTLGTKYESPTEILYTLGIVNGTSEHVFSANRAVTRAEMAKLIFSVYGLDDLLVDAAPAGKKPFKDVKESAWYYDYVCAASDMGFINGYSDGTFRPNETVTYAEAITMIIRALGYTELTSKPGESWEAPYIRKMNEIRLAKNVGYFKNSDDASRGNIAIMIWNMLNCETYMIVKEKTYAGFVRDNIPGKVIDRYYPDYAILDDDILTNVSFGVFKVGDEKEVVYFLYTKEAGFLMYDEPIPLRRIGVKMSGIYNIRQETAIGLNFIYDTEFDDGATVELEDIYKLKGKDVYTLGDSKAYAYVYMDEDNKVDRITYLGSYKNYIVSESKITHDTYEVDGEKVEGAEYLLINEKDKIFTSNILINEEGEVLEWSKVHEGCVISQISGMVYVLHEEVVDGILQEITTEGKKLILNIDGQLYQCDKDAVYKLYNSETTKKASAQKLQEFVGKEVDLRVSYANEVVEITLKRSYDNSADVDRFGIVIEELREDDQKNNNRIKLATTKGTRVYRVLDEVFKNKPEEGTLVNFEMLDHEIEFFDVFADGLELPGGTLDMNLDETEKVYDRNMLGNKYELDENSIIYIVEKEYELNSDKAIDEYRMRIESDREILTETADDPVHVLYDKDYVAIAVFIEKEINKHEYQYAKVLDIYEEKEKKSSTTDEDDKKDTAEEVIEEYNKVLKIKISPFNNVISEYKVKKGLLNCEPGDLISYKTNEEEIIVKERYNANLLGDKHDYIVSDFDIESKRVELTNGDHIDLSRRKFVVDDDEYLFEDYLTIFCKVSDASGKWKFISSSIENPKELKLEPGDRIAIDEIEDLIIIYRGYKD